jgi:hypothetical protein
MYHIFQTIWLTVTTATAIVLAVFGIVILAYDVKGVQEIVDKAVGMTISEFLWTLTAIVLVIFMVRMLFVVNRYRKEAESAQIRHVFTIPPLGALPKSIFEAYKVGKSFRHRLATIGRMLSAIPDQEDNTVRGPLISTVEELIRRGKLIEGDILLDGFDLESDYVKGVIHGWERKVSETLTAMKFAEYFEQQAMWSVKQYSAMLSPKREFLTYMGEKLHRLEVVRFTLLRN